MDVQQISDLFMMFNVSADGSMSKQEFVYCWNGWIKKVKYVSDCYNNNKISFRSFNQEARSSSLMSRMTSSAEVYPSPIVRQHRMARKSVSWFQSFYLRTLSCRLLVPSTGCLTQSLSQYTAIVWTGILQTMSHFWTPYTGALLQLTAR